MAAIAIERVTKRFGATEAVRDLSLEIREGEFLTLLGPSGCGKTTLLRMIAGFARPDAGTIRVGAVLLSSPDAAVPPERRGMGMVFQNYALWPHRTVRQNVAFGLVVRRIPRAEARERVERILELTGLAGLGERYPGQLSGGQQQRVALARSLVVEPGILLLDEPLSNLDAKLRERMRWELKEVQRRTRITFVYVTHDQAEAMALSDRIAVMHGGEIMQCGAPREVYTRPTNRTVADFMGLVNLVPGRVVRAAGEDSWVAVGGEHRIRVSLPPGAAAGDPVEVAIRPEKVSLALAGADGDIVPGTVPATVPATMPASVPATVPASVPATVPASVPATVPASVPATVPASVPATVPASVVDATFLGNLTDCHAALPDGTRVRVQLDPGRAVEVGQAVRLGFDPEACSVFDSQGERA